MSKHFIKVLSDIFVTRWDLKDKEADKEKTELYRALYLKPWQLYLNGHGSPSNPAPLKEINLAGQSFSLEFAYLAGIELLAFREWLAFLNDSIRTDMLLYVSCYSGGQHLQKVYEHQWDYPTGKKTTKTEIKPDIFNYMVVVSNLAYTPTATWSPAVQPPWKQVSLSDIKISYVQNFFLFFNACDKYFTIGKVAVEQKPQYFEARKKLNEAQARLRSMMTGQPFPKYQWDQVYQEIAQYESILNGLSFITLNGVVDFAIDVDQHQPAVRYPGSDSFVPLPRNEQEQLAARIRFESQEQTQQRKKQEARIADLIKSQAEKHIAIQKGQQKLPEPVTKIPVAVPQLPAKSVQPEPVKKPLPVPAAKAPVDTKMLETAVSLLQRKLNMLSQTLKKS